MKAPIIALGNDGCIACAGCSTCAMCLTSPVAAMGMGGLLSVWTFF